MRGLRYHLISSSFLQAGAVGSAVRVLPGATFEAGQTLSSSSCAAGSEEPE